MNLQYDEDLVEGAVFLCVQGGRNGIPPLQTLRFSNARDRLYEIIDPDARNEAFFKHNLTWFREWGLEDLLKGTVAEFPILGGSLKTLSFRKARSRNEEGAELFVHAETGRNGVVALRIERLARDAEVTPFLRHELTHLADMVDPVFGYSKNVPGRLPAQQQLVRGRYRLLWDITIDARLAVRHTDSTADKLKERHRTEFDRAFGFWSEPRRCQEFDSLWNTPQPRHEILMTLASDPRDARSCQQPHPGALCPLCGFSTFDWADVDGLGFEITRKIHTEFPGWNETSGLCSRCGELYQATAMEQPATLYR